ncbi:MAG: VCBS repeat-containing protein, partial [Catenulispora sp.]|nr:VCBS repeat-containing protein [Catenulispora sp.]
MLGSRLAAPVLGAVLCAGVAVPASAAGASPAAVGSSAVGAVSPQLTPPAITRTEMLQRAASWVGLGLQYNGNGSHDGYRTDCSGYVSMAWDLGQSLVTGQFAPGTVTEGITKSELRPGDALNNPAAGSAGHIVMFDKWTDSSQTSYWGYEFTGSGVHHRTIPYPYFSGYGTFSPVRDKSVVDVTDPGMKNLAAVGDQTGDGIPDIIGTEVSTGKLFRYAGPAYSGATRVQIGTGWTVYDSITAVGDLSGDGVCEI